MDTFLACCLRHCKEKPVIDMKEVANELGMTVGGAQNKYRDIMKKLAAGTPVTDRPAKSAAKPASKATTKTTKETITKTSAKRKASTIPLKNEVSDSDDSHSGDFGNMKPKIEASDDEDQSDMDANPTKKQKTTGVASKNPNKAPLSSPSSDVQDSDEDVAAASVKPPKTVAKKGTAKTAEKAKPKAKPAGRGRPAKAKKVISPISVASDSDSDVNGQTVETEKPIASKGHGKAKTNIESDHEQGSAESEKEEEVSNNLMSKSKPVARSGRGKKAMVVENEETLSDDDTATIEETSRSNVTGHAKKPSVLKNVPNPIQVNVSHAQDAAEITAVSVESDTGISAAETAVEDLDDTASGVVEI